MFVFLAVVVVLVDRRWRIVVVAVIVLVTA